MIVVFIKFTNTCKIVILLRVQFRNKLNTLQSSKIGTSSNTCSLLRMFSTYVLMSVMRKLLIFLSRPYFKVIIKIYFDAIVFSIKILLYFNILCQAVSQF